MATRTQLLQRFGRPPPKENKREMGGKPSKRSKSGGKYKINATLKWVNTGEKLHALYKETRAKAEEHAILRNKYYMKSVDAYLKGNRAHAKKLSAEGKMEDKKMAFFHTYINKWIRGRVNIGT